MHEKLSFFRPLLLLFAGVLLLTAFGCAQEVGDIDRVQANALAKANFTDGEWYIRQTISEVPSASFAGFVGYTSGMEKIRWEITEDYLIAYRSYENNPGANPAGVVDENGDYQWAPGNEEGYNGEFREAAVAAYPILSHFDIQRQYNAQTGEQTNVIVENSSDRLWYQREYFRVDWSNVLENDTLFDNWFLSNASFYVQDSEPTTDAFRMEYFDASNPGHPGLDADSYPNGQFYYMDFTNRVLVEPGYSYCFGLWQPMELDDCASSEVEMRTSLLRVPQNTDYEPIIYDEYDQEKFGYFRTERLVYDRRYGSRLSNRVLLGNRHNIWRDTWTGQFGCQDGSIVNGSDQCADGNPGRAIPRPYAERGLRPVVYYVSPGHPEELYSAAEAVAQEWDRAFRRTVAAAQQRPIEEVPQMFVLCHNPVLDSDHEACGAPGTLGRIGDLRYNFMYWVDNPQMSGPLGYGPSSSDPETGQIIAGMAHVYGAAVDTYAEYALEIVRFINNDLDIPGLRDPEFIRQDLLANVDPRIDPRTPMVDGRILDVDLDINSPQDMIPQELLRFADRVDTLGIENVAVPEEWMEQRWERLEESGLGYLAINDELLTGFGVNDFDEIAPGVRDRAFRGGVLAPDLFELTQNRIRFAAENNIWLAETIDDSIVGLAQQYAGRTDYEQMYQELRWDIYVATLAHEVGHTVGLRHNFQGSYDALNYHDEYWDMKTAGIPDTNGGVQEFHAPDINDANEFIFDSFMLARQTQAQIDGRMREYQYSSIMDYSSAFNTDIHGIGKYDEAAIVYAYTEGRDRTVTPDYQGHPRFNTQERGYVEVFNNVGDARLAIERYELRGGGNGDGWCDPGESCGDLGFIDFDEDTNPLDDDLLERYHYSTVAQAIGTDNGVYNVASIAPRLRDRHLMKYDDLLGMREAEAALGSAESTRPVEVPYMFMSDYWVGARQSVRQFDNGADPYEQALNMIERYRTYYPFEYFRRDRANWFTSDIFNRLGTRYFIPMVDNYQRWLFSYFDYSNGRMGFQNYWMYQLSSLASLNLLAEVMVTPSYGSFVYYEDDNRYFLWSWDDEGAEADLYIPPGQGRSGYSRWDWDGGYNTVDYPIEAGHFWATYAATVVMAASTGVQVRGEDTSADFLTYVVPPYLVYEDQMTNLFNSIYTDELELVAPTVENGGGKMQLRHRVMAPLDVGVLVDPETGAMDPLTYEYDMGGDGAPVIDLNFSFTDRYLPMMYGMAFFNSNLSLHFQDQGRIFRIGSGEELSPTDDPTANDDGFEMVTFCDRFAPGGVCYGALMQEGSNNPGVAARLILQANELMEQYDATSNADTRSNISYEVENLVEYMNILRSFYDAFGYAF